MKSNVWEKGGKEVFINYFSHVTSIATYLIERYNVKLYLSTHIMYHIASNCIVLFRMRDVKRVKVDLWESINRRRDRSSSERPKPKSSSASASED